MIGNESSFRISPRGEVKRSVLGVSHYLSWGEGGGGENDSDTKKFPDPNLIAFMFFGDPLRSCKKKFRASLQTQCQNIANEFLTFINKDPSQPSFWPFEDPHGLLKEIEGPHFLLHSPAPFDVNNDWSLGERDVILKSGQWIVLWSLADFQQFSMFGRRIRIVKCATKLDTSHRFLGDISEGTYQNVGRIRTIDPIG